MNDQTPRDKLYSDYAEHIHKHNARFGIFRMTSIRLTPHDEWNKRIDDDKQYVLEQMRKRECAMNIEGITKITGMEGNQPNKPSRRLVVILDELVNEGKLIIRHMADANDLWEVSGLNPPGDE